MKFSKIIFSILLLTGTVCHAEEVEKSMKSDPVYLYYPVNDHSQSTSLYIGKAFLFASQTIGFTRFEEIENEECDHLLDSAVNRRSCKINAYLSADKNNRSAMVKTLVNNKILFPLSHVVRITVE